MTHYLSTCISGLQEPTKNILQSKIDDINIISVLDGAIEYKTNFSADRLKNLKFVNNTFIAIKKFDNLPENNPFEFMMDFILGEKFLKKDIPSFLKNYKSFRIMFSNENQFISPNRSLLLKLEKHIITSTKNKLKLNINNPDIEFWFLRRRGNIGFFLLRITKNKTNKKLEKGELRPELTYILNYLSNPDKEDIFLDPFSGSGAIPISRATYFSSNLIFASDNIPEYKKYLNKKIKTKKIREKIIPKTLDATNLKFFEDSYITKIVTDPPWGEYKEMKSIQDFYKKILQEFFRILRKNGILILLTSKKQELEDEISKIKNFSILEKYDILVSGKKASIYKIIKN